MFRVSKIVYATAERIKINNIFNEVLPSTCDRLHSFVDTVINSIISESLKLDTKKIPALKNKEAKEAREDIIGEIDVWCLSYPEDNDDKTNY